jgi:hypothetical protein
VRAEAVECNSLACEIYSIVEEYTVVNNSNVIYYTDVDFGEIIVVNPSNFNTAACLPSQETEPDKLTHLSPVEQQQYFKFWINILMCFVIRQVYVL